MTTFFNPTMARSRLANYEVFRSRSRDQGLPLVTVELAFGDAPFQLSAGSDAEILIQRRSSSVLWQKERLLNLALAALPDECKSVCWTDADIVFEDDDWIAETERLLRTYVVLQPYSTCVRLPEGKMPDQYPSTELDRSILQGNDEGTYDNSVCRSMSGWRPRFSGSTGYVWCARRVFLDEVGFYDRCIVGGADREMALAVLYSPGKVPERNIRIRHTTLRDHVRSWHERAHRLAKGKVGYRNGTIHHLWHGSTIGRAYSERHAILSDHDFDPERDLSLDESGCLKFAGESLALQEAVRRYFDSRREDG